MVGASALSSCGVDGVYFRSAVQPYFGPSGYS